MLDGDKLLSFHTVKSEGQAPLVSLEGLEGLEELARLVLSRLLRAPNGPSALAG